MRGPGRATRHGDPYAGKPGSRLCASTIQRSRIWETRRTSGCNNEPRDSTVSTRR